MQNYCACHPCQHLLLMAFSALISTFSLQISFDLAEYTADVDGIGTLRLLDAIKTCGLINSVKFYQASTSELYGKVQEIPQKETTPFYPRSPYGKDTCTQLHVKLSQLWGCFCFHSVYVSYLFIFMWDCHL